MEPLPDAHPTPSDPGPAGLMMSLIDICDDPPVPAKSNPGAVHDIGGHRLRFHSTPHGPRTNGKRAVFDETDATC